MSQSAPSADLLARAKAGDGEARMELARNAARTGKRTEADYWINEAAAVGQRTAILQTGVWKLTGRNGPADPEAGLAAVRQSAASGEPAAKTLLAALYATDIVGARDWDTAKRMLLEGAEAHDPRALVQVALMLPEDRKWKTTRLALFDRAGGKGYPAGLLFAGRILLAEGGQESQALARLTLAARANEPNALAFLRGRRVAEDGLDSPMFELTTVSWQKIAEAIIWPHERPMPQPIVRHAAPRVVTLNRLFTPDECDYIISRGTPFLHRDRLKRPDLRRTNTSSRFGIGETDALIQSLDALLVKAIGVEADTNDPVRLLHYTPGEAFRAEASRPVSAQAAPDTHGGRQLIRSVLVYLNDGYEGGESAFPRLGWRYKGRRGDALIWQTRTEEGVIDPRAIPEGIAPRSGEKFVLTKLIYERPAEPAVAA